jgi:predicted DNA-binding protein
MGEKMAKKAKMGRPRLPEKEKSKVVNFYISPDLRERVDEVLEYTGETQSGFLRDAVDRATCSVLEERNQIRNGEASPNYPERDKNEIPKTTN